MPNVAIAIAIARSASRARRVVAAGAAGRGCSVPECSPMDRGLLGHRLAAQLPPEALRPQPEAVEVEVDDRRRVEGQRLADDQATDDGNTQGSAQLAPLAQTDRQGQG